MDLLKVGTAHSHFIYKYGYKGAFAKLRECGFDSVDFSFFAYQAEKDFILLKSDGDLKSFCYDLKAVANDNDVIVGQTHAPYYFLPTERYFDSDMTEIFIKSVKATAWLGSKYIVIHPIIFKDPENNFMRAFDANKKFYGRLKSVALDYGVEIAIENLCAVNELRTCGVPSSTSSAEKLGFLIDAMGEGFCACLDTGHAFFCGESPAHFARGLGKRLKVVHLQDGDGLDDMHIPPTLGLIDWQDFLKALVEIDYNGILNMEISYRRFCGMNHIIETGKFLSSIGKDFAMQINGLKGANLK